MNIHDRERLRALATKQLEIANSEKNLERVALWKRHNMYRGERPTIHVEVGTFGHEAITPQLKCSDPVAREIEYALIHSFIGLDDFNDDRVVPPYFQLTYDTDFALFGHHIKQTVMKKADGTELGHHVEHIMEDLEDEFHLVESPSTFSVNKESTQEKFDLYSDIFGDILPVRLVSNSLGAVPTQQVVLMMGMENMFYSMHDYPELFRDMMDKIADEYIAYFKYLESENVLKQNHAFEWICQGSMAFYDEAEKDGQIKTTDLWGYMDSQETVGVSPEMFRELVFPCYKKIAGVFGRLNYGCCEPVHLHWDLIKTLPNLKKVSISPWCDEDIMAEHLRDSGVIYHRKPNPTFLGVGATLDEDAFRRHIEKTIKTARGCKLEICQRDIYTVGGNMDKVRRYVEIIRESIDSHWQG